MTIQRNAKLIDQKKLKLHNLQAKARLNTKKTGEIVRECDRLEKEIRELQSAETTPPPSVS